MPYLLMTTSGSPGVSENEKLASFDQSRRNSPRREETVRELVFDRHRDFLEDLLNSTEEAVIVEPLVPQRQAARADPTPGTERKSPKP